MKMYSKIEKCIRDQRKQFVYKKKKDSNHFYLTPNQPIKKTKEKLFMRKENTRESVFPRF